jgi:hypothetical protein
MRLTDRNPAALAEIKALAAAYTGPVTHRTGLARRLSTASEMEGQWNWAPKASASTAHIAGRNLTARASAVAPLTVSGLAVSVNLIWR